MTFKLFFKAENIFLFIILSFSPFDLFYEFPRITYSHFKDLIIIAFIDPVGGP